MFGKLFNELFTKKTISYEEKIENFLYEIKSCKTEEFRNAYYQLLI